MNPELNDELSHALKAVDDTLHEFGWASFRRGVCATLIVELTLGAIVWFLFLGGWIGD